MCKYCEGYAKLFDDNLGDLEVSVEIAGNYIAIPYVNSKQNRYLATGIQIIYCPMCGRDFKENKFKRRLTHGF